MNLSPNYYPNRVKGKLIGAPKIIVLHLTEGSFTSAKGWLTNPTSQASCHALIAKDGTNLRLVKDSDAAWTNGFYKGDKPTNKLMAEWYKTWLLTSDLSANLYTLTIECEWFVQEGLIPIDSPEWKAIVNQCAEWCIKYQIPVDREHIIGHYEIAPKNKPQCGKHIHFNYLLPAISELVTHAFNTVQSAIINRDTASEFAKEAQEFMRSAKISDGTRPHDPVTREELWVMLHRVMAIRNSVLKCT